MNIRLNVILLCIVAVLGGWYYSQQMTDNSGLEQLIKKEGEPEYTGTKMSTTVYDLAGKPQYFAESQEIKRFESTERTEFLKPLLNLFDKETALKQWKVTADYAEVTKEKMLNLRGNVRIESLDPTSRLQKIETETLSVDLNTQDISTQSVVKSQGLGFTTTGTGLTGNLKKQVATLLKDVKTYIEPTVVKQTDSLEVQQDKDKK
ncbi:LPS export ABC transporter periplasmic protein LptC [Actinobacillus indolicus]|uniref:Lipopolysaccharide export system protein LptC n=1 Tax=Actinobacillus indolicus TaxID=51049 RepID=A0A4P7CLR3_9PAST|nr:LPS export ABC transporter periplasmic protein LptC [Actinobacillus indolicus]QBQ64459.1 LPS export ABC transporter periplasmic protein LptC [Actinobacillus indolicus]